MALVGVDVGAADSIIVLPDGEIVRNEVGGWTSASTVSFQGKERLVGETAGQFALSKPELTVQGCGSLAGLQFSEWETLPSAKFAMHGAKAAEDDGTAVVEVYYKGETREFSGTALLGMLLGKLRSLAIMREASAGHVIAVPVQPGSSAAAAYSDAAKIAGFERLFAFAPPSCICAAYCKRQPVPAGGEPRTVAFLELGHHRGAFTVATFFPEQRAAAAALSQDKNTTSSEKEEGNGKEDEMEVGNGQAEGLNVGPYKVLATAENGAIGAAAYDSLLFEHFREMVAAKYKEDVAPASKRGRRLLSACATLRKLLSTLPEAATTAENLCNDQDVPLKLTRETMAAVCRPLLDQLEALISNVLGEAGIDEPAKQLAAVELLGGGARMPLVHEMVCQSLSIAALATHMDDATLAFGAALMGQVVLNKGAAEGGEVLLAELEQKGSMSPEALEAAVAAEADMQRQDAAVRAISDARNAIESLILDMRGAPDREHGELIDKAKLLPYLDELEQWLFSDSWEEEGGGDGGQLQGEEGEAAALKALQDKLTDAKARISDELCAEYSAKVEESRRATEAQLEEAAGEEEKRRAEAGDEDDDHDFRKLKKGDRMRLVEKNKAEGNELFTHGNYRIAGARYTKALTHCAKFVDLSPEESAEVDAAKLSLYLNLANCYLKMENWEAAANNCNHALKVEPKSAKALYRRAYAQSKKREWDSALADCVAALAIAPEDKSVMKLHATVEAQIKKQQAKEKAMWSKAFAS